MESIIVIIGWIWTGMIISAYFLLTTNKLKSTSLLYQMLNLCGAIGVLTDSYFSGAFPSVWLQIVWIFVAMLGISKILIKKHS